MFDSRKERDIFLDGTTAIDLNVVEGEGYARWRLFQFDALGLLRSHFDADCEQWYEVARQAAQRPMDGSELEPTRKRVVEYRLTHLGFDDFDQYIVSQMDALTRLFMFALEEWPVRYKTMMPSGIGQDIDTVTSIINKHFGYGQELVDLIVKRYQA